MLPKLSSVGIACVAVALFACGTGEIDIQAGRAAVSAGDAADQAAVNPCPGLFAECKAGVAGKCGIWEAECRDSTGYCPDLYHSCGATRDVAVCGKWEAECRDGVAGGPAPKPSCDELLSQCRAGARDMCEQYEKECR